MKIIDDGCGTVDQAPQDLLEDTWVAGNVLQRSA